MAPTSAFSGSSSIALLLLLSARTIASAAGSFSLSYPDGSSKITPAYGVGLSFGGYFNYYIASAVQELIKYGLVVPGETLIAGSGGGGEVAAITCSGGVEGLLTYQSGNLHTLQVLTACSLNPGANGCSPDDLGELEFSVIEASIPNTTSWLNCEGRALLSFAPVVAISGNYGNAPPGVLLPTCPGTAPSGSLVADFYASRDDLIAAVVGTSFVPLPNVQLPGDSCAFDFRGKPVLSAVFSDQLPVPPIVLPSLKVAAYPPGAWPGLFFVGGPNAQLILNADIYPGLSLAPDALLPGNLTAIGWLNASADPAVAYALYNEVVELAYADVTAFVEAKFGRVG